MLYQQCHNIDAPARENPIFCLINFLSSPDYLFREASTDGAETNERATEMSNASAGAFLPLSAWPGRTGVRTMRHFNKLFGKLESFFNELRSESMRRSGMYSYASPAKLRAENN